MDGLGEDFELPPPSRPPRAMLATFSIDEERPIRPGAHLRHTNGTTGGGATVGAVLLLLVLLMVV
jgi:hypothetical protein